MKDRQILLADWFEDVIRERAGKCGKTPANYIRDAMMLHFQIESTMRREAVDRFGADPTERPKEPPHDPMPTTRGVQPPDATTKSSKQPTKTKKPQCARRPENFALNRVLKPIQADVKRWAEQGCSAAHMSRQLAKKGYKVGAKAIKNWLAIPETTTAKRSDNPAAVDNKDKNGAPPQQDISSLMNGKTQCHGSPKGCKKYRGNPKTITNLQVRRMQMGLSQKDVAELVGTHERIIYKMENGLTKSCSSSVDANLQELFGEEWSYAKLATPAPTGT